MNRETAILQLMLTPRLGARTLLRLLKRLAAEGYPVEDFVAAVSLESSCDLTSDQLIALKDAHNDALSLAEELSQHDIRMVAVDDSDYPARLEKRLGRTAPPVLFARGNISLLALPAVGFAGARDCSETGMKIASSLAGTLAGRGVNIVSGYAQGIDTAAHAGALEAGGATTIVAATGILGFRLKSNLTEVWDEANTLVVSEFPPRVGWHARNAMQRNRTIGALSNALVIVEAHESGGTFAAGTAALEFGCPLYVVDYPDPPETAAGNRHFLKRGAHPISVAEDGSLEIEDLLTALDKPDAGRGQSDLFE